MAAPGSTTSGEDDLIARYFRPLATSAGAFGLVDDAAVLAASGDDLVVTVDTVVEGVHYLPDDPPETIARKALRVNLSDLAAKGATPAGFVMSLALRQAREEWLAPFAHGLKDDIALYHCPLLGGDTVSTPGPVAISITAFGHVPSGAMVRRTTAQVGDHVVVSGTIGDAALGLRCLQNADAARVLPAETRERLIERYRVPQPRLALAALVRQYATAAMDVSDGLAGDLAKLCAASGVSADVALPQVPVSPAAQAALDAGLADITGLIAGGDDYEILCTIADADWPAFQRAAGQAGVRVSRIGIVTEERRPTRFFDADGHEIVLARRSFSHF